MSRVLVIEDDPGLTRMLRLALERDGHEVATAPTGQQALWLAAESAPDVVILDLGLPDLDGKEVIQHLRSWSQAPLLVISGRGEEAEKVAALDVGADDYLEKPVGVPELQARIRALTRRASQAAPAEPTLRFGDLEVDLAQRVVTMDSHPLRLTPIEFRFLREFVTNPGKLLTQRWLLQRIWGAGRTDAAQYLRVYVGQLRRKLSDDPNQPRYIETQPRVGYRWVPTPDAPRRPRHLWVVEETSPEPRRGHSRPSK